MTEKLRKAGERVSENTVAKIMQENDLVARKKRRFKATTDSKHTKRIADNLLQRGFTAGAPNQVWVTDVTAVWTDELRAADPRRVAGRHEVTGLLGRGGMGAVYRVRDLATGDDCALKLPHRVEGSTPSPPFIHGASPSAAPLSSIRSDSRTDRWSVCAHAEEGGPVRYAWVGARAWPVGPGRAPEAGKGSVACGALRVIVRVARLTSKATEGTCGLGMHSGAATAE